jgi:diaminopimelate decarboxylase
LRTSPPLEWNRRYTHQRELIDHEADQLGKCFLHEAVRTQVNAEPVHTEPRETDDDISGHGHCHFRQSFTTPNSLGHIVRHTAADHEQFHRRRLRIFSENSAALASPSIDGYLCSRKNRFKRYPRSSVESNELISRRFGNRRSLSLDWRVHFFEYRDERLYCEDVDLSRVAAKFGTPTYVYSAGTILDHYIRLDAALASLDHLVCYAVKANSNRAILKLLVNVGAGFDIVSGGELFRVLTAGGDPAKCTFAGVGKSREEIGYALDQGVYSFNVESEAELESIDSIAGSRNQRAPVALRVNPDVDPHTHRYISTGSHENKFGIALSHVGALYEGAARMRNIDIVGVQMHIGSQITDAKPFAKAIGKVAPLVRELKSKYAISFFSIGGGMGIIYRRAMESGTGQWWHDHGGEPSAFSVRDYANAIVTPLRELNIRILVEPGRFLVGNAGVLLTRVLYIKQSGTKKFAIVDAGMNDLIRPALYQSYHEIVPVIQPRTLTPTLSVGARGGREAPGEGEFVSRNQSKRERIDIVGPVCESGDFFAIDRKMPALNEGDLLAIISVGAYGFVMASNYNSRALPAEVLVRGDKFALIRKRETWEDLMRGELDADW